ncbi:MAG: hypothetical protein HYT11_01940 [Candidatus Levybacteria bacterium]|nr:hypothetical protein [Candidatus Levybacteria bacterium]
MFFFPSTSLAPTVIALSTFFLEHFPNIDWYPYWYLGNPYYYLIGPVVPVILGAVRVVGAIGVEEAYLLLLIGSIFLGAVGLCLLLSSFGIRRSNAFIVSFLYLMAPGWLILLSFQDGLHYIAFGFFPSLLLLYKRFLLSKATPWSLVSLSLFLAFLLLITVSILLPFLIAVIALIITYSKKEQLGSALIQTTFSMLLALSLATLWYTPGFWLTLLTNPSFGGVPLYQLTWSLFRFAVQFLPLILAIIFVKWRGLKAKGPLMFGLLVFSSFLFLSVFLFLIFVRGEICF